MILVLFALLLGVVGEAKTADTGAFGMQPCMDLTDNCVALVAKGICQTKTSYLCALSCYQCLPEADNPNYQPNPNIVAVDTKNPPDHNWPSPFPPDVKNPNPESNSHKEKRQIPDPFKKDLKHDGDHPEDNYPHPEFDPDGYQNPDLVAKKFSTDPDGYDVSHQLPNDPLNPRTHYPARDDQTKRRRRSAVPIPPPIHDLDSEKLNSQRPSSKHQRHQDSSLPIMPPEDNIPFPHTEGDTFVYPPLKSKLVHRHKRQMEHPLKRDQRPPSKDPFPFEHRDPGDHFPQPSANNKRPDKSNIARDPTNISPSRQMQPIPYPLHPDDDSPFPWDPVGRIPNHMPIPGKNPLNQSPDGRIPKSTGPEGIPLPYQDPNDPFLYPHRDPTEYRPFPHYNPKDQLPIPHYDPRDQIPRPHQNPGSEEVNGKRPDSIEEVNGKRTDGDDDKSDIKLSKDGKVQENKLPPKSDNSKKPQGMRSPSPDSDIFKLSGPLTPSDYEYSNQKDFNPYSPDSSSSEEFDPFYPNFPPRYTGPNHQIPTTSRHHKGRKPRHGGKDKKGDQDQSNNDVKNGDSQLDQTPESASVYPLHGDNLNKKDQVDGDDIPGTITDITDYQKLNDSKKSGNVHHRKKRQTNDEGIHVLYDDPFAVPDGYDPTEVEHQLDEPLKKDQFPYPNKKLYGSQLPGDTSRISKSDSHPPIGSKLDSDDQWQEGTFPLPGPIDIDRQASDPHEAGHVNPTKKDQYPFPDTKVNLQNSVHQKQYMNPYGMGGLNGMNYGGLNGMNYGGLGGYGNMGFGGLGNMGFGGLGGIGNMAGGTSPMSALNAQYATIWCQLNPATGQPLNLQFCNYYTAMSRTPYGVLQGGTKQPNTEGGEVGYGKLNKKKPKNTSGFKQDATQDAGKPGQATSGTGHDLKKPGNAAQPKSKLFHDENDQSKNGNAQQSKPDQFQNNWGHMSDIPKTLPEPIDDSNKFGQRGGNSRSSEQSFNSHNDLPDPLMHQIPSPDEIVDPKEGPRNYQTHPKNIKLSGNQVPNEAIPVPDEIPSIQEQPRLIKKHEEHHFPRPTPARPLPDTDDFNPFDQFE